MKLVDFTHGQNWFSVPFFPISLHWITRWFSNPIILLNMQYIFWTFESRFFPLLPDSSAGSTVTMSLKFRYSEKVTKFWKNLPILRILFSNVKKLGDCYQIFVYFSEYFNFNGKGFEGLSPALRKIIVQTSMTYIILTLYIFLYKSNTGENLVCPVKVTSSSCALLRSMTFYGHIFPWPLWPLCLARVLYISWPSWHTTT